MEHSYTKSLPTVSVVVPSRDRLAGVTSLIHNLRRQDYPRQKLQILIIDDGSPTPYNLPDEDVQLIRHDSSQGAQKSRNEGILRADGEIALIMDDDIELLENDFISRAVDVFLVQPDVAAVVSKKYDIIRKNDSKKSLEFSTSRATWYSGDLVRTDAPCGPVKWGHGIYFVRRWLLIDLGGYDGIYGLNGGHSFREESDVHARLRQRGWLIWFLPDIAVNHNIVSAGGHGPDIGKRLYWIAHNHLVFIHRHLSFWPLRAVGFLFDVLRYSWVQGRFRYIGSMLRGYAAGWRNALRDRGPGRNAWLE